MPGDSQDTSLGTWVTVAASAALDPNVPNVMAVIPLLDEDDNIITLPPAAVCRHDFVTNFKCVRAAGSYDDGTVQINDDAGTLLTTLVATGGFASVRNVRGQRWILQDTSGS